MLLRDHVHAASAIGPAPFHGTGGTMNVEQPRYQNPLHEEFFRACAALGIQQNTDFNNWSRPQVRAWWWPLVDGGGLTCDTAAAP